MAVRTSTRTLREVCLFALLMRPCPGVADPPPAASLVPSIPIPPPIARREGRVAEKAAAPRPGITASPRHRSVGSHAPRGCLFRYRDERVAPEVHHGTRASRSKMAPQRSTFQLTYGAALGESVYVAGVALELEDKDVPHTILWERVGGQWRRYQWKNRTYGMVAYANVGAGTAAYLGYEGTLKIRSEALGSSEERLEPSDDGPSSLRTVSGIRVIGSQLFVVGMRRMVFQRALTSSSWARADAGVRQERSDLSLAGFYSIDGPSEELLYAAGMRGELWRREGATWDRLESPTQATLSSVRSLGDDRLAVGGERGALWLRERGRWHEVAHSLGAESFGCIERWRDRTFVCSEAGALFELALDGAPRLERTAAPGVARVSWLAATAEKLWVFGTSQVVSLSDQGWRDESPPEALLT